MLRLHEATLIDADFGYTSGTTRTATLKLQAGLHPLHLTTRHATAATATLALTWSGPGLATAPIPASAFCR